MPAKDSLVGHQLANYQIHRLLGRGGMASVYYGMDLHLQRPAAIKVIDDRYRGDSDYSERFLREARAMASWRHPNIPQIYQAGEDNGIYYYAMEYIQGMDLEQGLRAYAQRGELLPYEDVLLIIRSVAEALDYAHQKGAIHRDVKPSNILISEDDRILLSDFGLVLQMDKGTKGEVFGSPHYIAPEQARNSAEAVPQSDFYALGVILYEMLVGKLPFDDPSPAALALKHITEEPPAPRTMNPDLSLEVEDVLLKAMRKNPRERFATGTALVDALARALIGQGEVKSFASATTIPRATLPALPDEERIQLPRMVSQLRLVDLVTSDRSVEDSTLTSLERNAPPPPDTVAKPGVQPRVPDQPKLHPWMKLAGFGCGVFALAAVLFLVFGTMSLARWMKEDGRPALPAIAGLSSPTVSKTPRLLYTSTTAITATNTAVKTATSSLLKATPTWKIVFLRTPTRAPTRTPTQAPTRTPVMDEEFHLLFIPNKDDSVYLINKGIEDLSLPSLIVGNETAQLEGDEWETDILEPGQCVTVWKKEGNPKPPKNVDCKVVGERLEVSGLDKFWVSSYHVFYQDVFIKTCRAGQPCDLQFQGYSD